MEVITKLRWNQVNEQLGRCQQVLVKTRVGGLTSVTTFRCKLVDESVTKSGSFDVKSTCTAHCCDCVVSGFSGASSLSGTNEFRSHGGTLLRPY